MNSKMGKWFGYIGVVAFALVAGNAWGAGDFASDAMTKASGFTGGTVSGFTMTVTDGSTLQFVEQTSPDAKNRQSRGWYAGVTIAWPEYMYMSWPVKLYAPYATDGQARMKTSRMLDEGTGEEPGSGNGLAVATDGNDMESTTWWAWITPEEAFAANNGTFQQKLNMYAGRASVSRPGVNAADFYINFDTSKLKLTDPNTGILWFPAVATNAAGKVYGDLNVALKASGTICSVADAAITNAITLEAGVVYYKNGKNVSGLDKLTLLGGSYDFDPESAGCTIGKGCIAEKSGDLWVVHPCTHNWTFKAEGDTFTATCSYGCGYTPQELTVKIDELTKTYDGKALVASLKYGTSEAEFKAQTGATVGDFVWKVGDAKSVGDHTVSVTIMAGGADYEITKTATITAANLDTASVTLKTTEVLFTGLEQTNAIASVTSAAGIDENDWDIVDKTALYGAGSGYSNVTYTVTLQGKRNYTGTTTVTWTVKAPTREFDSDAMGRGDYDVSSKLYNENYGEAVGRELVVTASTNIIFVNGYWWVGMTVDLPTDINVLSPSSSSLTDDDNLRVTLSTTGKTYTGTQIYNKQVTDALFQIVDGDHASQWWSGIGTFQYFKTLRWFTPVSPAMIEEALGNGGGDLEFTMTVGGITGRWEGLKYTDFTIKVPVNNFIFKVRENESADIGNVSFTATKILLKAGSVVTNACAIDYVLEKNVYTDVAGNEVLETKVSDSCWVYSSETVADVTIPNVDHQASKVVTLNGTVIEAIDQDKTLYRVHEGDTLVITYTAQTGYVPATAERTMENVTPGATLTDLPVFTWPAFTFDPAAPEHTKATVTTNGVELTEPYVINSNDTVHVVYTATNGCYFADGTTEKTIDDMTITADTVVPAEKIPEQAWPAHTCDGVTFTKRITDAASLTALFKNGGNGYLASDVTLLNNVTSGASITNNLCLNGYVLTAGKSSMYILGDVTIHDCGMTRHYFTYAEDGSWALTEDAVSADTNLVGGVVTGGAGNYPAFYVSSGGAFTVKSGNFVGNKSMFGGVVCVSAASSATIEGGTFAGNASTNGGVLYGYQAGSVVISGGLFAHNQASYGGALCGVQNAAVNITGGSFEANQAQYGGAYYASDLSVTIGGDAVFTGNVATNGSGASGSAIYNRGKMTLKDNVAIEGNMGIWGTIDNFGTLTITGDVQIVDNVVYQNGGAIYNERSKKDPAAYPGLLYLYGGLIAGNSPGAVSNDGGVVTLGGTAELYGNYYIAEDGQVAYDFNTYDSTEPLVLSEDVPWVRTEELVGVGMKHDADGTNSFLTVVTNAVASDVSHFTTSDWRYMIWFDAADKTLKLALPVAQIVTNGVTNLYAKVDEAFADVGEKDTVQLLRGCASEGSEIDKPVTLDVNEKAITNLTLGADAVLTLSKVDISPNKLRATYPMAFGDIAGGAKVITDTTYVYHAKLDTFIYEGTVAVATTAEGGLVSDEGYTTFDAALAAVATNGTVYALMNITNDGFTVKHGMTIDLVKAADDAAGYTLTIASPARKTVGIEIGRQVSNVTFRGGTVKTVESAALGTLLSSSAANLTLDGVTISGDAMTNKTVYAVALNEGATTVTNSTLVMSRSKKAYALYVSCYGVAKGNAVSFLGANTVTGNALVNVQNAAPVEVAFGNITFDQSYQLTVNAYKDTSGIKTRVTKAQNSVITLAQPEFSWSDIGGGIDQLVFGKVQIVGEEEYYSTLAEAMEDVVSGQTIRLCADVEEETGVEAPVGMTLDLNGHTLTIKGGTGDFTVDDVTVKIVGTNENSRIVGDVWATDYYGNSTCLSICGGTYIGQVAAYGSSVLNIADAIITRVDANETTLQLGTYGYYGSTYDKNLTVTVVNSRITGYSAACIGGGSLTISNSVLTAFGSEKLSIDRDNWMGGTGDALVIDQVPGCPISVTLEAGTKLQQQLDIGCDQLGWYTNAQGTVTATVKKRDGVDALAVDGYYWAGDVGDMLTMTKDPVPPIPTIPVPMVIAKNTLNLAPAFTSNGLDPDGSVNVGGEEVTIRPEDLTITVGETADTVSFTSIPDFTYELLATDTIGGTYTVVDRVRATDTETTLTAPKTGASARFYTVRLVP